MRDLKPYLKGCVCKTGAISKVIDARSLAEVYSLWKELDVLQDYIHWAKILYTKRLKEFTDTKSEHILHVETYLKTVDSSNIIINDCRREIHKFLQTVEVE